MKVVSAFQLFQPVLREIICKMAKQYLLRHIIKENCSNKLDQTNVLLFVVVFLSKIGKQV